MIVGLVGAAMLAGLGILLAVGGIGGSVTVDAAGGTATESPASAGAGSEIAVDVAGAVARPGLYRLSPGSRVADAIAAAGGFGPRVAAARVATELNLASPLHDAERVVVPSRDDPVAAAGGSGGPAASGSLIDLNRATEAELESLPGIGAVTAGKIVASRADAPFRTVDDLRDRKLVGEKTLEKIRALITVG